jgi:haloacetate dehalogenase
VVQWSQSAEAGAGCTVATMFERFDEDSVEVADGTALHVRTAGAGAPVVLLHGYPQTGVCWHRVAPALAQRYSVVVPDLRGYGRSSTPPDDDVHSVYAKRTMAADVIALMSSLGHERFAVVGHDRGGRVGYRLALDHPARVERLCTLDIVPTVEQFELLAASRRAAVFGFHWYFLAVPPPLPETLIGARPSEFLELVMGRWAGSVPGADAITPEAMTSYVDAFTPAVIAASCADYRAGATFDAELDEADRAAGTTIACPVHALWGDRRNEVANREVLATWRRWTTAEQPVTGRPLPCGHFIPEELPDVLVDELLAFLG